MRAVPHWLIGSAICLLAASVLLALTAVGAHTLVRYSKVLLLLIGLMNMLVGVVFVYILTRIERRSLSSTLTAHAPLLSMCCDSEKEVNGNGPGTDVQVVTSEVHELKQHLLARKSQQQKLRKEAEATIDSALTQARESQRLADQQAKHAEAQRATVLALQNEKEQLKAQVQDWQAKVDDHVQARAEEQQRREQHGLDQGSSISTSATPNEELASLQVRYQELTAVSESKDIIFRKMSLEVEELKKQLAEKHSEEQQFSEMRSWLKMRIDALENSSRIAQQKIEELKMSTEGTTSNRSSLGHPYSPSLSPIRDERAPRHERPSSKMLSSESSPSSPTDLPLSFSQEASSTTFQYKAQSLAVPPTISLEDKYGYLKRQAQSLSVPAGRDKSLSPGISQRPSPKEQSPASSFVPFAGDQNLPQQSTAASFFPMQAKLPEIVLMAQRTSSVSPSVSPAPTAHAPVARLGLDTNLDGRTNVFVTGVDRNHDGIPDVLQQVTTATTTTTTRPRSRQSSYQVPARSASPVWAEVHPPATSTQMAVDRLPGRSASPACPGEAPRTSLPMLVPSSAKSNSPLQSLRGAHSPTPAVQLGTAVQSSATAIQVGNTVQCSFPVHVPSWSMTPVQVTQTRSPRRLQANSHSPVPAASPVPAVPQTTRRTSPPRPPNPRANVARQ